MLTLLTATGCRPKAWAICEKLMMAQNYTGAVRWVIVDDGEIPQTIAFKRDNWTLDIVRPSHRWKEGLNTQADNLIAGLEYIDADDSLVIIEDDDNYSKDWLRVVERHLQDAELVGEILARYYNIKNKKYRQLQNTKHASLCATAMRGEAIETFRRVCESKVKFIDIQLWALHKNKLLFTGNRVTGIKGLAGRDGIGMGHKNDFIGSLDFDLSILNEWVGESSKYYV